MATTPQIWNKRLGNNVKAGLTDIQALGQRSRETIGHAAQYAAQHGDTNTLTLLVEIANNLADIEKLAMNAQQGKYQ